MITFFIKTMETMTDQIDLNPQTNRVIDFIEFNNLFFIKYFFNYIKLNTNLKLKTYLRQ